MKVTFLRDFDYSPPELNGAVTVAYRAGQTITVPHAHAEAAEAAGAIEKPKGTRRGGQENRR